MNNIVIKDCYNIKSILMLVIIDPLLLIITALEHQTRYPVLSADAPLDLKTLSRGARVGVGVPHKTRGVCDRPLCDKLYIKDGAGAGRRPESHPSTPRPPHPLNK